MSNLGLFVDRQTLGNAEQLTSLVRLRDVAESMEHTVYFIFPTDIKKITKMDALFIRARTDPMNISYVASTIAELHGIPVIDDPASIQICSDKVNMYLHLTKHKVPIPQTQFLRREDLLPEYIQNLFREVGSPLILKEPSTSFSLRVEKVETVAEFIKVTKRFLKLSDWIVVQKFIESQFDWRIGILNGELLYACKYIIPSETFKIQATVNGHVVYCAVKSIEKADVPEQVIDVALNAGAAIGSGLYGVDIKERNGDTYVIEVNDNPSLEGGEDEHYPNIYEKIISHLLVK